MSLVLKQVLFANYGGFADKRLKKIERDAPFEIDDRKKSDFDARGQLFLWFCAMQVQVVGNNKFELRCWGGVPHSKEIDKLVSKRGGTASPSRLKLVLAIEDTTVLQDLADAVERMVKRGGYAVPSYKYVCPRTAASLRRLAGLLDASRFP